jgi:poly(3-hydroxybutyrate) depolymerase
MTYKLNCELSDRFAGMMTIGMSAGSSLTPGQDARCQPAKTLPHLNMCGTNDFICARGWEKQFEDWAVVNNCTDSPVTTDHSSTTKCYKHSACSVNGQQVKVEACGINGLGHCWPGNNCCDAQCANQDPANIDGSDYMLNFLLENGVSLQ